MTRALNRLSTDRFFFFQAEDGIRDYKVTGVQTCALPILIGASERDGDVLIVPAGRVRRRRTAAGDRGSRLVDVDAADRRGVGAVAGFVGAEIGRASCRERV